MPSIIKFRFMKCREYLEVNPNGVAVMMLTMDVL